MASFFIELCKIFIIFVGYGFATLIAYYLFRDSKIFIKLFNYYREKVKKEDKIKIEKRSRVSPQSGFYEISFGNRKRMKIFSSPQGIKTI